MDRDIIHQLEISLGETLVKNVTVLDAVPCVGGDINRCYKLTVSVDHNKTPFFVKLNSRNNWPVLAAEKQNLDRVASLVQTPPCPKVICHGVTTRDSFLILEYLNLKPNISSADYHNLALCLASFHEVTNDKFGWFDNNFIGASSQSNRWHANWATFWLNERLEPQWRQARNTTKNSELLVLEDQIFAKTEAVLKSHKPTPVLCHGDLWAGNASATTAGKPVMYDPACYFGDPETDLAMTLLFGGFPEEFYSRYYETRPPSPGHTQRLPTYQLYHLLNHMNLFGSSYLHSVLSTCSKIINTDD